MLKPLLPVDKAAVLLGFLVFRIESTRYAKLYGDETPQDTGS